MILEDIQLTHHRSGLESGIDGLAFESQDAEDAFMNSAQRLLANEPFQSFNTKGQLSAGERSLGTDRP